MIFSSVSGKNWLFKKFLDTDLKKYSDNYSLSEIVARLLAIRKNEIEDISIFLNPTIKDQLINPLNLKDMSNAVDRTYLTIKKMN